jgi:hypothetical protein
MKTEDDKIVQFCTAVKMGFGSIADSSVKKEYERVNESEIDSKMLGRLLAILEKHSLLDKKSSVNKQDNFYQVMYTRMING